MVWGVTRSEFPWAVPVVGALWALLSGCDPVVLDFSATEDVGAPGGAGAPPDVPEPPRAHVLTVDGTFNITRDNSSERSCSDGGDGVFYRVRGVGAESARLHSSPGAGCLGPGDEVLLIHLQGTRDQIDSVGQHELLRVLSVADERVTFVSPVVRDYGGVDAETLDGATVILQRVPTYSRLLVREGAQLTADAWSTGEGGGVLAVRVLGDAVVDGTVTMSARGFHGGPSVDEELGHGIQGESIAGLGAGETGPNFGGGGGGLGDQTTSGCVQDGNAGGGGGHVEPGQDAVVTDLCGGEGAGAGGGAIAGAGRLFLGPGGGSGGVDNVRVDNPPGGTGGAGGGIIWLLAQSVTDCYDHSGPGGGGAGGSIRITAPEISGVRLAVGGGRGGNGNDNSVGNGGDGSPGIVD